MKTIVCSVLFISASNSENKESLRFMQERSISNTSSEVVVSVLDIWLILLCYKRLIIFTTILGVVFFAAVALIMPNKYTAYAVLIPAIEDKAGRGVRGLAGQLGGLAGISALTNRPLSNVELSLATLSSRAFIKRFVSDNNLKPVLFKKRWDVEKQEWIMQKPSLFGLLLDKLMVDKKKIAVSAGPSDEMVYRKFANSVLFVSRDPKTSLITVSVEWDDGVLASDWVNELVRLLNLELQQNVIDERERGIKYLYEQLDQTHVAELKLVIYRLIEENMKSITLAKGKEQFALKTVDPAVPPDKPSKPKRMLLLVFGFFIGLGVGIILAFVLNAFKRRRTVEEV